jgi:hypothetical protein
VNGCDNKRSDPQNYVSLTSRIFNKYLFRTVNKIKLYGVVNNIQSGLFLDFLYLTYLDFQIDNFKQFFHYGNNWMKYLYYSNKIFL